MLYYLPRHVRRETYFETMSRLPTLSPRLSLPLGSGTVGSAISTGSSVNDLGDPPLEDGATRRRHGLEHLRLIIELAAWHAPQRIAAATLFRVLGVRMHEPIAAVIDARLAVGASPLCIADVLDLATKFRVGSVLEVRPPLASNSRLCLALAASTYSSMIDATANLEAHERIGLAPDDLRAATAFIRQRIDAEPHKRVLVACPDGVRFAPVIAAAFVCSTQRLEIAQAIDLLERRLPHRCSYSVRTDPALRVVADKIRDDRELDGWSIVDKADLLPV